MVAPEGAVRAPSQVSRRGLRVWLVERRPRALHLLVNGLPVHQCSVGLAGQRREAWMIEEDTPGAAS